MLPRRLLIAFVAAVPFARIAGSQATAASTRASAASVLFWNQQQREAWFSVMDTLFPVHVVKAAFMPRPLRQGASIPAFAPGGTQSAMLDAYIANEKVAGILVLHDGAIRLERYAMGYGPGQKWTSFSVAKSFTSTLVGAAVRDGFIKSLDDPVTRYITAMKGSAYDDVTIRQLLTMTSGVKWNEDYTDPKSDVAQLFASPPDPGLDQTVSYMRKLPREAPAGTKWVYKTGETNLIGNLVMEATHKSLSDYLSEKIWAPVGMEIDATWIVDAVGHEAGGCCLQASLRDYARFGLFILGGTQVGLTSILPDGWLDAATKNQVTSTDPTRGYGYQWWTEDQDRFMAIGIHGQSIHLDPDRRLVIVINSAWPVATGRERSMARAQLWRAIEAAIDLEPRRAFDQSEVDTPVLPAGGKPPRYPDELLRRGGRGEVVAQFVVDTTGLVELESFKVLRSTDPLVTQTVKDALPYLRFTPALRKGKKVRQLVQQPFAFGIR